jgi:hypothetical protein
MYVMWSNYRPAQCYVNATSVDIRVCSCSNPYVGVASFVVLNTTFAFSLDVSCEATYDQALAMRYQAGKTYDCLYNGKDSVMWPRYQSKVLFDWMMCSAIVTGAYAYAVAFACVLSKINSTQRPPEAAVV